jgi:hypothetical protein
MQERDYWTELTNAKGAAADWLTANESTLLHALWTAGEHAAADDLTATLARWRAAGEAAIEHYRTLQRQEG